MTTNQYDAMAIDRLPSFTADPTDGQAEHHTGSVEMAPGFRDSIIARDIVGPHETETEYGLIGGNILHARAERRSPRRLLAGRRR